MPNDTDALSITPGLAIAAADLFRNGKPDELREIARAVDAEVFAASCIQLTLMVIDWISLSRVGDELALAYETDDTEALDDLKARGARFEITEDGTLDSWLEYPNATAPAFPIEFWEQFKFSVQTNLEQAAVLTGVPAEVIRHLTAGMVNDGVIDVLSGKEDIAVPSAARFFKGNKELSDHAVVAANAFIAATVLDEAAKSRTYALQQVLDNGDTVTYEEVVEVITESIRSDMLEQL